jgi:YidC/Oxa1 family membrane protein insertase
VDTRRLLLALALSFAVLFLWYRFFPPPEPAPEPPAATAEAGAGRQPEAGAPAEAEPEAAAEPAQLEARESAEAPPAEEEILTDTERTVVVENDRFIAELSNRGAVVTSFRLKEHESRGGGAVDLVRRRAAGPYPFALVGPDLAPLPLDGALFTVEETTEAGARVITFRYRGPAGDAEKRFTFNGDETFGVEVEVGRPRDWALFLGPGLGNPTPEEADDRMAAPGGVYLLGGDVERAPARKAEEPVALPGSGLAWAGLEDRYFLTALIPRRAAPPRGARFTPMLLERAAEGAWTFTPVPEGGPSEAQEDLPRDLGMVLEPAGEQLAVTAYWGEKSIERLARAHPGLDDTVGFGMFGFFSRGLLVGLDWIHDHVVPNYGWSIVLLTVVIKLLLLPLTHKSYISMRKMQQLAPKMQAIRERYRPKLRDKKGRPDIEMQRKMNEEIMALYKSEGVNPAGGCLPMLLQLPVLFAFYRLLYVAVELRGAPWMLWIDDLSIKDPYYVLPIVMGATQFIQTRMTPMAGDPMQRRLFQLMPVVMTVFFLGFPSGLVLYWLTNNVLTIAQQAVYNRVLGPVGGGDKQGGAKSKGGRKK